VAMLLTPFLVLSVIGLVLSLIVHIDAPLGLPQPLGPAAWGLHIGIFVVCVPGMIVASRIVGDDPKRKDAARRACPGWMRWLTYGFLGYAVIDFLLFMAVSPPRGAVDRAEMLRGFSGSWMAFYSLAASSLYATIVLSKSDAAHR
jgi:hypothetical protein